MSQGAQEGSESVTEADEDSLGPYTSVDFLHDMATHGVASDWDYTRHHDIRHIRYAGDWSGYDRLDRRILRALAALIPSPARARRRRGRSAFTLAAAYRRAWQAPERSWAHLATVWAQYTAATLRAYLRTEDHRPDGVLDGGAVITHWEETGEYLQMVQPSVGALLAKFLREDPSHPNAVEIRTELDRLYDRYQARAAAGEVD